jgi:hypothetical protein
MEKAKIQFNDFMLTFFNGSVAIFVETNIELIGNQ